MPNPNQRTATNNVEPFIRNVLPGIYEMNPELDGDRARLAKAVVEAALTDIEAHFPWNNDKYLDSNPNSIHPTTERVIQNTYVVCQELITAVAILQLGFHLNSRQIGLIESYENARDPIIGSLQVVHIAKYALANYWSQKQQEENNELISSYLSRISILTGTQQDIIEDHFLESLGVYPHTTEMVVRQAEINGGIALEVSPFDNRRPFCTDELESAITDLATLEELAKIYPSPADDWVLANRERLKVLGITIAPWNNTREAALIMAVLEEAFDMHYSEFIRLCMQISIGTGDLSHAAIELYKLVKLSKFADKEN